MPARTAILLTCALLLAPFASAGTREDPEANDAIGDTRVVDDPAVDLMSIWLAQSPEALAVHAELRSYRNPALRVPAIDESATYEFGFSIDGSRGIKDCELGVFGVRLSTNGDGVLLFSIPGPPHRGGCEWGWNRTPIPVQVDGNVLTWTIPLSLLGFLRNATALGVVSGTATDYQASSSSFPLDSRVVMASDALDGNSRAFVLHHLPPSKAPEPATLSTEPAASVPLTSAEPSPPRIPPFLEVGLALGLAALAIQQGRRDD